MGSNTFEEIIFMETYVNMYKIIKMLKSKRICNWFYLNKYECLLPHVGQRIVSTIVCTHPPARHRRSELVVNIVNLYRVVNIVLRMNDVFSVK